MKPVRRAIIDVGTNSIKLLVADVTPLEVRPVWEGSIQTRLGQGFYESRRLQPAPIAQTAEAVAAFAETARRQAAVSVRVVATSAARDAVNPEDLHTAVAASAGLKLDIISGEQEARWAFQGVTTDPRYARQPLLLLDVGGGSTEFVLGQGRQQHFAESFPLGTVRLLQTIPHSDPPAPAELAACRDWLRLFLRETVFPKLAATWQRESESGRIELIGTGGTASILARLEGRMQTFSRERVERHPISFERVRRQVNALWSLPLAERQHVVGLPRNRADVILTGLAIYEAVMEQFGFAELRVSTRGLRYAALLDET